MTYCFNTKCPQPQNQPNTFFCQRCQSSLVLAGHYRAVSLLGQGDYGKTFLGVNEDNPNQSHCVIKQFYRQSKEIASVGLFLHETEWLCELNKSKLIPAITNYFEQDDSLYLFQELIDGQNLGQKLRESGIVSEKQMRRLLNNLLPLLQFLHNRHVCYDDIQPENIILGSSSQKSLNPREIKNDFAVEFGDVTLFAGKPLSIANTAFSAPEKLSGQPTFASDIYSLGVTCIHLMTNVSPLELYSETQEKWIWQSYLQVPCSSQLRQILNKMIARDICLRYNRASDILKDLQRSLAAPKSTTVLSTNSAKSSKLKLSKSTSKLIDNFKSFYRNKWIAIILALVAGRFGAHKFYLRQIYSSLVYLALCWTWIPIILSIIEALQLLAMSQQTFDERYNPDISVSLLSKQMGEKVNELKDLKKLYDQGIITTEEYDETRRDLLKRLL